MQDDKAQAERISNPFTTLWGGNSEIQGDDDLKRAFGGLVNTFLSEAEKKVRPNDKAAKTFLNAFKAIVPTFLGQPREKAQEESSNPLPGILLDVFSNIISEKSN